MRLLITGCAGFIGSALARHVVHSHKGQVLGVDAMTYAATLGSVASLQSTDGFELVQADIRNGEAMAALLAAFKPDAIAHLAAETHVDRSIDGPRAFLDTNVAGTHTLLEAAVAYWRELPAARADLFRFLHVSTDEVFGALGAEGDFDEHTPYAPRSPYAASKASSDHFVRAFHATYGLPTIISNCSNNYGSFQFPEKLIPLMIINGLEGKSLPLYGDGLQVRDWIAVEDHVAALQLILERGAVGETYLIGARAERTNRAVVALICAMLDEVRPGGAPHGRLVVSVADRPGHDRRYAINPAKIERALGWRPAQSFEARLRDTVGWYIEHQAWWQPLRDGLYDGKRLGLSAGPATA
jgi:dTDP-glucose 4,6-dehydratase